MRTKPPDKTTSVSKIAEHTAPPPSSDTPPPDLDAQEADRLRAHFAETVFLIALGVRERERAFEDDRRRYPYSANLRHGIQRFAALHMKYAADTQKTRNFLSGLSESSFIRTHCTRDLATWISSWTSAAQKALASEPCLCLGPLVDVEGDFFSVTTECDDGLLALNKNYDLENFHEFKVYNRLRAGSQEGYVLGRKLLIMHPTLTYDEHSAIATGNFSALGDDPLDQGEGRHVDHTWLATLVALAYEPVIGTPYKVCPACGWTVSLHGLQPICLTTACVKGLDARTFHDLTDLEPHSWRLHRGVMRYISHPGTLELDVARKAKELGLPFELWPTFDTCDVLVTLPDGRTLAIDAKDYKHPHQLARSVAGDTMRESLDADEGIYVVPSSVPAAHLREINASLSDKAGYSCMTLSALSRYLKRERRSFK